MPPKVHQESRPIREHNKDLSGGLEKILIKCMHPDPEKRFQTCEELQKMLERYYEYDELFIEEKKKRKQNFLRTALLSGIFLFLGIFGFVYAGSLKKRTYEEEILLAGNALSKEESIGYYKKAMELDPSRSEVLEK